MSSIRPLVTISILIVVGVFLFNKINEGPSPSRTDTPPGWDRPPLADVPPLGAVGSTAPAPTWGESASVTGELSPQWTNNTVSSTVPSQGVSADASPPSSPTTLTAAPTVPAIPELPPLAPAAETTPPAVATSPIPLPTNIPIAQYPGDAGASSVTSATQSPAPEVASPYAQVTTNGPDSASVAPLTTQAVSPVTSSEVDRYAVAAETTSVAPFEMAPSTVPSVATPTAPTPSLFASTWPQIQSALARQELVAAHEMLSQWYGNPQLTPGEKAQVESLLAQLAGTVVYSTEHRLEPPYTVHTGDTLQTIAQQYEVPWQLLAKINGIPAANLVQPGQQLKVVHGPFAAVVELDESQLTLMLDGRYAGRFPISIEPSAPLSEGQWVLEQKLLNPTTEASGVVSAAYAPAAVDRVLVLRNESPTAGGATISITGGQSSPSGPTAVAPAAIRLSARDAEEVADILSVGSPVTIRR